LNGFHSSRGFLESISESFGPSRRKTQNVIHKLETHTHKQTHLVG